jgi:hypothetical protein
MGLTILEIEKATNAAVTNGDILYHEKGSEHPYTKPSEAEVVVGRTIQTWVSRRFLVGPEIVHLYSYILTRTITPHGIIEGHDPFRTRVDDRVWEGIIKAKDRTS